MKTKMCHGVIAAAATAVCLCAAPVHANEGNESTYFTFSAPVALPGIALPAGTYLFKHPNVNDFQVVQVFSQDGRTIYGTFLTIPETRAAEGSPKVTFAETPRGTPEEIKAWFYPGRTTGHEFIYSASQAAKPTDTPRS
jgi:hypothetical protein